MSGVLAQAWSIARSGWRAQYNRVWRFSRFKSGAIVLAMQLGTVVLIGQRAAAATRGLPGPGLPEVMALMAVQFAWFGLLQGFARGQFQLYTGILVPLLQMTPARPMAFLLGRVLEAVPQRLYTSLLWAWAYSAALAGPERWAALPALWLTAVLTAMLAHLSGLLTLTLWSRLSPGSLRTGLFAGFGLTLAAATWGVIYLARGGSIGDLAAQIRATRGYLFGAVAAVGGLPGLALLLGFLFRPHWVENLYRQGLNQVLELAERSDARPRRSYWLPLPDGLFRPVLSREWLTLARSMFTRMRLMVLAAGAVGVWAAGGAMAGREPAGVLLVVGPLSLLAWGLPFGPLVTGAFTAERVTLILYRITGTPALRLLAAKLTAVLAPATLLTAAVAGLGLWRAGLPLGAAAPALGWILLALAAGVTTSVGLAAATAGEEPEEPDAAATGAPQRDAPPPAAPGSVSWALARLAGLIAPMALAVWLGAGQPWVAAPLPPALPGTALLLLPLGALAVGGALMYRDWDRGQA